MNNVIPFARSREVREEMREQACAWLARLDAGASPEDLERLECWLSEDAAHAEALLEMAKLWDQLTVLAGLADIFPLQQYLPRRRYIRRLRLAAGSAALLAAVTLVVLLIRLYPMPQRYATAVGEQGVISLSDGSEMVLNTNTLVEVRYVEEERSVWLERGEALFDVASDPDRPFRVYAGDRVVEAVGTAFSVQRRTPDSVEVLVTEGRVNLHRLGVEAAGASVLEENLEAGEFAVTLSAQTVEKSRIPAEEIADRLAWRDGMLLFQGDPLEQVLEEFSRYTTIRIEADESVRSRNIRVRGYYPAGDVDRLLVSMQANFQIGARRISADHIILTAE